MLGKVGWEFEGNSEKGLLLLQRENPGAASQGCSLWGRVSLNEIHMSGHGISVLLFRDAGLEIWEF